ncbi:DNA gyrase, A subunit [Methanolacinia petrolearia DSM 11571]|uniref:DNA gyrase subunit A n=1 Tax=Methanolacinia petrolearia (strain DSM 11571 / OCM 486 / SEBR 4847) TaxID=679926 RepID=E1RIX3_METP4|nr:DNA gyrase subunit A [Methanolacinia petrolearia]ADN35561.1 DNA gyrase, A subunit [Methanolacinia petrolearia DSM 11571]
MTSEENSSAEQVKRVLPVSIEEEMKSSYLDYAMSVIVGRAIPDVRDGLKPVHRRTLYAMGEMGNYHDKPFKKSARIVGEVMGKYHPHGDSSIYDTLVKMAQPFSYRYMLVEGQGNFGSIDGDSAAAMRYTEARLDPVSESLLEDIDKETVDFGPNFDESLQEPLVLPAKIPNLLVNGSDGIAVGMATKMPPHNIGEVCSAVCAMIDDPEISPAGLMEYMPGPDFPTGGVILGRSGIASAYTTGRGRIRMRGVAEIEDHEGSKKSRIIISEIPYQVNKARLIEQIADLVRDKKIDGISDIRDESDKDGIRVVIELKKSIVPMVVLNQLYKHTPLESTFGVINLAIVDNQPKVLTLKEIIQEFLKHRKSVIYRRTIFELKKAEDRLHILRGLLLALDNIDAVIATIRGSSTTEEASQKLIENFGLDEIQADAILKMQLRRLAALEQQKIIDERDGLLKEVERLKLIISDEGHIFAEIKKETLEISEKYSDERRTKISHDVSDLDKEDLIENKQVLVSLTSHNYIKSMPLDTYKGQHRGGRGIIGMSTKDEDFVKSVFVASTHDYLLCFTSSGRVYWLKVYDIPEATRQSRGKAIVNLLELGDEEKVTAVIPVSEFKEDEFFLFATLNGMVVKIPQVEFSRPRQSGIYAITLKDGDELVHVMKAVDSGEIILTTRMGQSLRFGIESISLRHRNALGVKGIKLRYMDELQDVTPVEKDHLLTITEKGYGKRTEFDEFRGHGRATMGVRNIQTDVSGGIVSSKAVSDDEDIILMSRSGIVIRTKVSEISIQKRGTRGVRIMKLDEGDSVVGFTILDSDEGDEAGPDEITE